VNILNGPNRISQRLWVAPSVGESQWLKRLREAPADDLQVLFSHSRAHHSPYPQIPARLVQRIEEIREHPPENLQRTPGPRAILYYLHRDQELLAQGLSLPRSTRTSWRILRQLGCILDPPGRHHRPQHRPEPMEEIQLDFKDATSVPPDPDGKQQHVVEICNVVDAGTSTWLMAEARSDFHAESAASNGGTVSHPLWVSSSHDL